MLLLIKELALERISKALPTTGIKLKKPGGEEYKLDGKKNANKINPKPKTDKPFNKPSPYLLAVTPEKISIYATQIPTPNSQNLEKGK